MVFQHSRIICVVIEVKRQSEMAFLCKILLCCQIDSLIDDILHVHYKCYMHVNENKNNINVWEAAIKSKSLKECDKTQLICTSLVHFFTILVSDMKKLVSHQVNILNKTPHNLSHFLGQRSKYKGRFSILLKLFTILLPEVRKCGLPPKRLNKTKQLVFRFMHILVH